MADEEKKCSSEATTPTPSMDDVINSLGLMCYTYTCFAVGGLSVMSRVVNLVGAEFMAPVLEYSCADPLHDHNFLPVNGTECEVFQLDSNNTAQGTVPCQSFVYDNSTYQSTVTSEFNMVCSEEWLRPLFQMSHTLGAIVGSPIGGAISDRYGRQPAVWYGTVMITAFTVLLVTVPVLEVIMVSRFFMGVFTMIMISPAFTIGLEVCPLHLRSTYGVTVALPYAVMLSILAGIAYLNRYWRNIQLWGSVPLFVLLLFANPLVLHESPRWLVSKGRLKEAEAVIRRAAKLNRTDYSLPDDLKAVLGDIHEGQQKHESGATGKEAASFSRKISSLVSTAPMRKLTIISGVVWLLMSALYISIPLAAHAFESPFLYMAILGVAEIPAYTISAPITARVGRKPFVVTCLLLTTAMKMMLAVLVAVGTSNGWASTVIAAVAYTFICSVYQVTLMYSAELFPTTVRGLGTSICFLMSNVGFNIPPILDTVLPASLPWLPMVIYSVFGVVAASLVLLLPETNRRPLMQTVQEYVQSRTKQSGVQTDT